MVTGGTYVPGGVLGALQQTRLRGMRGEWMMVLGVVMGKAGIEGVR